MKTCFAFICLMLFAAFPLVADESELTTGSAVDRETRLLQRLLSMESGELAELRQTIERIEQMTPEERDRMRARIKRLHSMRPGQPRILRDFYRSLTPEARAQMLQKWRTMPHEDRRKWRRKLREMAPEDRIKEFETNGFLPVRINSRKQN